jgi:hypothetical protein
LSDLGYQCGAEVGTEGGWGGDGYRSGPSAVLPKVPTAKLQQFRPASIVMFLPGPDSGVFTVK